MSRQCDLGDPGWEDPWFPHGVVLLLSPVCMTLCVLFSACFFVCFLAVLAILGCDDTKLPSPA